MIDALLEHRLLICVGPGGVGKTTLAAALALAAVSRGKRVAVITIDPARRLADALGLDGLNDALRSVETDGPGELDAAMLDTKASYDALIARVAPDDKARARILENRVYRSFSRSIARSHAYVAMERLYDVVSTGRYDLVVLDTPPTRSALDILDAPSRLTRFLDERVLRAFVGEGVGAAAWVRAKGAQVALRLFGTMVGDGLMRELAEFFSAFFHLRRGFAARAEVVQGLLTQRETGFVLVTAPQPTHLADAAYLAEGLVERGGTIEAVLFNRAFIELPEPARVTSDLDPVLIEAAAEERARLSQLNSRLEHAMASFRPSNGPETRRAFPHLAIEPASLDALEGLLALGRDA